MAKILAVTGPVSVVNLSQKVDARNLLDLGLTNASADLTKHDIYLGVFQAILAKSRPYRDSIG